MSTGVVCLHGFTGTSFEIRHLADRIASRGYIVAAPILPGHGTEPEKLNRTTSRDWRDALSAEVAALRRRCDRVAVIGQSLGGLLTLDAAARPDPDIDAAATLAAPLWFEGPGARLIQALSRLPRHLTANLPSVAKRGGGSDVRDAEVRAANPAYPVLPLSGVMELCRLMRDVRSRLEQIRCPLLVVHGRFDHTAPPACAAEIVRRARSREKQLVIAPESYHLVACDVDRDMVAAAVGDFLDRVLGAGSSAKNAP